MSSSLVGGRSAALNLFLPRLIMVNPAPILAEVARKQKRGEKCCEINPPAAAPTEAIVPSIVHNQPSAPDCDPFGRTDSITSQ